MKEKKWSLEVKGRLGKEKMGFVKVKGEKKWDFGRGLCGKKGLKDIKNWGEIFCFKFFYYCFLLF